MKEKKLRKHYKATILNKKEFYFEQKKINFYQKLKDKKIVKDKKKQSFYSEKVV